MIHWNIPSKAGGSKVDNPKIKQVWEWGGATLHYVSVLTTDYERKDFRSTSNDEESIKTVREEAENYVNSIK